MSNTIHKCPFLAAMNVNHTPSIPTQVTLTDNRMPGIIFDKDAPPPKRAYLMLGNQSDWGVKPAYIEVADADGAYTCYSIAKEGMDYTIRNLDAEEIVGPGKSAVVVLEDGQEFDIDILLSTVY